MQCFKENSLSATQFIFSLLNKSFSFAIFFIKMLEILETFPKIPQVVFILFLADPDDSFTFYFAPQTQRE